MKKARRSYEVKQRRFLTHTNISIVRWVRKIKPIPVVCRWRLTGMKRWHRNIRAIFVGLNTENTDSINHLQVGGPQFLGYVFWIIWANWKDLQWSTIISGQQGGNQENFPGDRTLDTLFMISYYSMGIFHSSLWLEHSNWVIRTQ